MTKIETKCEKLIENLTHKEKNSILVADNILLKALKENGYIVKKTSYHRTIVEVMLLYAEKKDILTKQQINEIALQEYPLKLQSGLMSKEGSEPEKVEFDMNKNQREIFKTGLERAVREMMSKKA